MELKSQAGTVGSASCKKNMALFNIGTPQEWIDTQKDIFEIWRQNNITAPKNRILIIKTVLRGETLTIFESAVADLKLDADGYEVLLTNRGLCVILAILRC